MPFAPYFTTFSTFIYYYFLHFYFTFILITFIITSSTLFIIIMCHVSF